MIWNQRKKKLFTPLRHFSRRSDFQQIHDSSPLTVFGLPIRWARSITLSGMLTFISSMTPFTFSRHFSPDSRTPFSSVGIPSIQRQRRRLYCSWSSTPFSNCKMYFSMIANLDSNTSTKSSCFDFLLSLVTFQYNLLLPCRPLLLQTCCQSILVASSVWGPCFSSTHKIIPFSQANSKILK